MPLKWIPRVISVYGVWVVWRMLALAYMLRGGPPPTTDVLCAMEVVVLVGYLVSWRAARTGALLSLGAMVLYTIWSKAAGGWLLTIPFYLLLSLPPVVFLTADALARRRSKVSPIPTT
jgi:hypothetical protein